VTAPSLETIDRYLPADVRSILEERFWRLVQEGATLEAVSEDATLVSAPESHPALFADHGIVHARDVAARVVDLAAAVEGRFLPYRPEDRREFVVGLAVMHGLLHDVGMHDPTPAGRRIHAIRAANVPFSGEMDDVLSHWSDSGSEVVRRITRVNAGSAFRVPLDVVLRELASLAVAHSKSSVPAAVLGDPSALRKVMQKAVLVDLEHHRRARATPDDVAQLPFGENARWYEDPARDAYSWLASRDPAHTAIADDAIDAVRLVRAADALRQRGTTLRTAAGYEIFIDAETGQAVFALRTSGGDRLFLVRADSPLSAGEANVRTAVLAPNANLRVSFHRGRFSSPAAAESACDAAARVVADIGADVLGAFAFRRPSADLPALGLDPSAMQVELERPADDPSFAERVAEAVGRRDLSLGRRVVVVADLENASSAERARYHQGRPVSGKDDEASEILATLEAHGMKIAAIDRGKAFEDVRRVHIDAGETLLEAGSWPAFVYIALKSGLRVQKLGGYGELVASPWIPIGVTGVVRRAERNSTVVATEPGDVLMIPGELFVREWFRPYEQGEIATVLAEVAGDPTSTELRPGALT
jgi:hypothetical protein